MEIHTPAGAIGAPPFTLAAPLPVLAGRRIGVLENGKPNAAALLARLADRLGDRTGASVAVVENKNAAIAAPDQVMGRLIDEVDLVLTGSAD